MLSPNRSFNSLDRHPVSQACGDFDTEESVPQDAATIENTRRGLTDFGDLIKQDLNSDLLLKICKNLPLPDLKNLKLTGLEGRNLADLILLERPVTVRVNAENLAAIKSGNHPYEGPISLDFSYYRDVADEDLALIVQNNPNIAKLNLNGCCNITDAGLQHLAQLTSLQSLDLSYCDRITDAGLEHLAPLTKLQSLDLRGCYDISDAGRQRLYRFMNLENLCA